MKLLRTMTSPILLRLDLVKLVTEETDALKTSSQSDRRITESFRIGKATVRRYRMKLEGHEDLTPKKRSGRPRSIFSWKESSAGGSSSDDSTRSLRQYVEAAGVGHVNVVTFEKTGWQRTDSLQLYFWLPDKKSTVHSSFKHGNERHLVYLHFKSIRQPNQLFLC